MIFQRRRRTRPVRKRLEPVGRRRRCPPQCEIQVRHEHHKLRWRKVR